MATSGDVRISKKMSWLLRHAGQKEGLRFLEDGFVGLEQVLSHKSLSGFHLTTADIERIVHQDNKGRYTLKTFNNTVCIRANQGHSMDLNIEMSKITADQADRFPTVVHGTYEKYWPSILRNGLSRRNRRHIHFCNGHPTVVRSGVRHSVDLLIYIDLSLCLSDGIEFFLSDNNVVLSAGIDGLLPCKYFSKVCRYQWSTETETPLQFEPV